MVQTAFGLKISSLVIDASMGMLWLALILCGIVCLILGMGLPTQIIYLTLAVLVAPAIVKMGVTVAGAHLFIIYYGMLSMVTPPVCFAAFAAAGIAGAGMMRTGWEATKISIAGLLAPFYFAYHPGVLLIGDPLPIAEGVLRAVVGIYCGRRRARHVRLARARHPRSTARRVEALADVGERHRCRIVDRTRASHARRGAGPCACLRIARTAMADGSAARSGMNRRTRVDLERTFDMTVRAGREFLAIPGPTTMPDEVLAAMHRPAIDIYAGPLVGDHRRILRRPRPPVPHRAPTLHLHRQRPWRVGGGPHQRAVEGRQVLVLESGRFAIGWGSMATGLGCEVEVLPGEWNRAVGQPRSRRDWRQDTRGEIKAVLVVQVDTASGVVNDIPAIGRRSRRPGTTRCSWSTPSPRSAACRSRWMRGASTSPWPPRRRA